MNLSSVVARRDPDPLYRQLRERTPVLHVPGPNLWIVLRHAALAINPRDHVSHPECLVERRQSSAKPATF